MPVPMGRLLRRGLPPESSDSFQLACMTGCGLLKRRPKGIDFVSPAGAGSGDPRPRVVCEVDRVAVARGVAGSGSTRVSCGTTRLGAGSGLVSVPSTGG